MNIMKAAPYTRAVVYMHPARKGQIDGWGNRQVFHEKYISIFRLFWKHLRNKSQSVHHQICVHWGMSSLLLQKKIKGTVKPALATTCIERPTVFIDHIFSFLWKVLVLMKRVLNKPWAVFRFKFHCIKFTKINYLLPSAGQMVVCYKPLQTPNSRLHTLDDGVTPAALQPVAWWC